MASRLHATIPQADLASHNTAKSCYVVLGTKVYDITPFLEDHPGGGDLILEHGGKDVTNVLQDEISHIHSESAYEILEDHFVGYVATDEILEAAAASEGADDIIPLPPSEAGVEKLKPNGFPNGSANGYANGHAIESANGAAGKAVYANTGMSSADDLSRPTDARSDYQKHKFLDLERPLLMQLWFSGFSKEFYLEQVHRPRHYKGGDSAPLFGNFLEPLSKTPWWVVPTVWLPAVVYGTWLSAQGLPNLFQLAAYWITGLCIWTLVEYGLHRCLFHIDKYMPDNRAGITLHFLLHGIHHYLPMDRLRLVMPPTLLVILATPFWKLAHTVFFYNWFAATAVYCGGIFGYICYDMTHYFLHHRNLPSFYRELKKYHLQHHFADYENGFGVTSRFWDRVFKTELPPPNIIKTT